MILPKFIKNKLDGREDFIKILLNVNWLLIEKGLKILFGFFITIYEARYLGPEKVGVLYWSFSFVSLFMPLSQLGLNSILVRDFVKNVNQNKLIGTAFYLKLIGSVFLLIFSFLVIWIMHPGEWELILMVVVIAFGFIAKPFDVIDLWFQSVVKSKYAVYSRVFSFMIVFLLKAIFIVTNGPLMAFTLMFSLDFILTGIGYIINYEKVSVTKIRNWVFSRRLAVEMMREGWLVVLSASAIVIMSNIDQVMIGEMLTANEMGQFAVARKLIDLTGFLPVAIIGSFAPAIARAKIDDENEYKNRLLKLYRVVFFLSVFVAVGFGLLSKPFVSFAYGETYTEAGFLLAILGLRFFLACFGGVRNLFITNNSLFKLSFIAVLIGVFVNVVLNYIMIPIYRAEGAIIATYISFIISNFMFDFFIKEFRENFKLMMKSIFDIKGHYFFIRDILS